MHCATDQQNLPDHVICNGLQRSYSRTDSDEAACDKRQPHGNVRYVISAAAFLSLFNCMTTRACINVAIVAMVNSTQSNTGNTSSEGECPKQMNSYDNQTSTAVGEFEWTAEEQSLILSVFYYGYVISQIPGGYLAERFSCKLIIAWTLLSSGLLCVTTPVVARFDFRALVASRFFLGLFQGPIYPSIQALWGVWAPPLERSRLMSFANSGGIMGDLVGLALTGVMCNTGIFDGWPFPFYVFGGSCLLYFVLWIFIYNDPQHLRCISEAEKQYITMAIYASEEQPKYHNPPWKDILTCAPFYGILLYSILNGMSYYVIFICGPTYMKEVLNFDIAKNGMLNAAPYVSLFLSSVASGPMADFVINKRWMSVTITRKAFTLCGGLGAAGFIVAMGYSTCDPVLPIVFLITAWGIGGLATAGPSISGLDISPQHAGTLLGVTNMFNNFGGFLSPLFVQLLTHGNANRYQWQKVFFMTAGFSASGAISYAILGSSDQQRWAVVSEREVTVQDVDDGERQPLLKRAP